MTASADSTDLTEPGGAATAAPIELGTTASFGRAQTSADYYIFRSQWKTFTVTRPSNLTVTVEASAPTYSGAGWKPNGLDVSVINPSGNDTDNLVTTENASSLLVKSDEVPNKRSISYKVLPGAYFIRAIAWGGSYNGYGTVTVSAAPVTEDPGGEPNDTKASAKPIKLDTVYTGNIGYHGKATSSTRDFSLDREDYYLLTVPKKTNQLRITFSRTNDGTEKNLTAQLLDANGSSIGERISLKTKFSVTEIYSLKTTGKYYFRVDGNGLMYQDGTEYRVKAEVVKQAVTKVKLNKKTLKLKKGKKYTLKAKLSPANVYSGYKKVTWKTSNKKIVKVSSKGKITAVKKGKATITVKTHNGKTAKCKVQVI
jgi:uncharacterized protein YjdB